MRKAANAVDVGIEMQGERSEDGENAERINAEDAADDKVLEKRWTGQAGCAPWNT